MSGSESEFESADEGEGLDLNIVSTEKIANVENLSSVSADNIKKITVYSEEETLLFNDVNKNTIEKIGFVNEQPLKMELEDNKKKENFKSEDVENKEESIKRRNQCTEEDNENTYSEEKSASDQRKEVKTNRIKLRFEERLEKSQKKHIKPDQEKQVAVLEKLENLKANEETNLGWNWGSWKSSIFSTAASSVSVFTSQVSQGIGTVFEGVEATLGVVPPEELAASIQAENEREKENENFEENTESVNIKTNRQETSPSLFEGVSSLTKAIENTSSKVIMGGLDTLELIGKKTIDIITDGDPGLRKKRLYFSEKNSLSEVLKEAKEKENFPNFEESIEETVNYSQLFENFKGFAHLEALELLSRQSKSKVQELLISQSVEERTELKEYFEKLKNLGDLSFVDDIADDEDYDQEFIPLIENNISILKLDVNISLLQQVQKKIHNWLKCCQKEQEERVIKDPKELYQEAITSIAEFSAKSIELFHKIGELLLTKSAVTTTTTLCAQQLIEKVGQVATLVARQLAKLKEQGLSPLDTLRFFLGK